MFQCHKILRWLKKEGIKWYRCYKGPLLTKKHMKARLKFAREMMSFDWKKV